MICKYCGNEVDDNLQVCPVCNSPLYETEQDYEQGGYEQTGYEQESYAQGSYDGGDGYGQYDEYGEADDGFDEDLYNEDEGSKKNNRKKLSLPKLDLSVVISAAAAVFSFICLVMACMLNANLKDRANTLEAAIAQVQMSYSSLEGKINDLDSTVANVQKEAYNQLASTNITITKDLTSLTGPVTLGKYNMMFIIKAKGNLDLSKSFEWQKYNPTTNGWEDIVFTGKATSNEQFGLRLENLMENGEYKSVLWANGITKAAEGTYRCVISDVNGIKKTSYEASVLVTDAAA